MFALFGAGQWQDLRDPGALGEDAGHWTKWPSRTAAEKQGGARSAWDLGWWGCVRPSTWGPRPPEALGPARLPLTFLLWRRPSQLLSAKNCALLDWSSWSGPDAEERTHV